MATTKIKLNYSGSLFWLIFFMIIFFPVGVVLAITGSSFEMDGKQYSLNYDGSRFWLCFWTMVFFPVAILFAFLNGFSVQNVQAAV